MRHIRGLVLILLLAAGSLVVVPTPATAGQANKGEATGRAVACSGPAAEPLAHLSVYRGDTLVQRTSVPASSTFRFVLAPGTYVISNQGHPGRYVGSDPFHVRAGRTTHVVVRNFCM